MQKYFVLGLVIAIGGWGCGPGAPAPIDGGVGDTGAPDTGPPDTGPPPPRAECEGLDIDWDGCLLPWPSSRFLVDPAGAAQRIEIPETAMPENTGHVRVSPEAWNARDGFSPMTSMIVRLEGQIDATALNDWQHVEDSLTPGSATVLLDTTTPSAPVRVAHYAEIQQDDGGTLPDPAYTTLYVRPAARLTPRHHYVVAVRNAVEHLDHTPVRSSRTFEALRAGTPSDWPGLDARRTTFDDDVFVPLTAADIARDELIVAWDFWTGSDEDLTEDLLSMRDQAFAVVESGTLGSDIIPPTALRDGTDECGPLVTDPPSIREAIRVTGTFDVPWFLDVPCDRNGRFTTSAHAHLSRDPATGLPRINPDQPTCRAVFVAIVPDDITTPHGAPIVQYGHGLFQNRCEVGNDWMTTVLAGTHSVGVATDLYGLDASSMGTTAIALTELSTFTSVDARVLQGLIAQLVLGRTFAAIASDHPELQPGGVDVVDRSQLRWVGNSEGGIMGPTIAALDPRLERAIFGVGGISYPIMMPRSWEFAPVGTLLDGAYPRRITRDLLMVMFASHFDLYEGATYAAHLDAATRLPAPPTDTATTPTDLSMLYQIGVDDLGTPEVSGEIAARTMHLSALASSATARSGIPRLARDALPSRAFTAFDFQSPTRAPVGLTEVPPPIDVAHSVHEQVRRSPQVQAQMTQFLTTGTIPEATVTPFAP